MMTASRKDLASIHEGDAPMTFLQRPAISPIVHQASADTLTGPMTIALAASVGVIFLNVLAPQTLVGVMGPAIGLHPASYGLVATAPLLGYAGGLFFLTPLADCIEAKSLILRTLLVAAVLAAATPYVHGAMPFLGTLFMLGFASAAVQMIVPLAAAMAAPERRGRAVGDIMSGLMLGILFARPIASLVDHVLGWRLYYLILAVALVLVTIGLAALLPRLPPRARITYATLIRSLVDLLRSEPVLRRRSLTAALGLASFSIFWTAIALELASPRFGLGQTGIALFALAGAGGAVVAPLAGRAGDRGWTRIGTIVAHVLTIAAFAVAALGDRLGARTPTIGLAVLALSAIVLDVGVFGDQTFGRRAINLLNPDARARLNGLFVGIFFVGGSIGSALVGLTWTSQGWPGICAVGAAFAALSLLSDIVKVE
jgi:predicted MFS family arabinose efflux permease